MNTCIRLPFGLNEVGRVVHITEVRSGKSCHCVCPSCHAPLIAAKGTRQQHHFKHALGAECPGGLESAIHRAAKQLIQEKQFLYLPKFASHVTATDSRGVKHTLNKVYGTHSQNKVLFTSIEEEQWLHGMRVDLLGRKKGRILVIEIYYRHRVDLDKIEKLKEANCSAVEIDLSKLTLSDLHDTNAFWNAVNNPQRIYWLHHAKASTDYPKLEAALTEKLQKIELHYQQEVLKKRQQEPLEQARLAKAFEEIKHYRENMQNIRSQQPPELHPAWLRYSRNLQFPINNLPDYLNVDVPDGDWIYGCDRRVWQSAVYHSFILNNKSKNLFFSIHQVDAWLRNAARGTVPACISAAAMYSKRHPQCVPDEFKKALPSSWRTLKAYFKKLCALDLIFYVDKDYHRPGSCWYSSMNSVRKYQG